jgi:predicted type IV restriction endonuclease
MSLELTIADITARLRQSKFPNEQTISQGVLIRRLQELSGNTWETTSVWPEYQTGEGRVDFALCHSPRKPAVFIEIKQPGKAEVALPQALEYAFQVSIPSVSGLLVRTCGYPAPFAS